MSFKNFPQFVVMHTVKGFSIINETEVDIFLEFLRFFYDPVDFGNMIQMIIISTTTFLPLEEIALIVALIVNKRVQNAVLECNLKNDRIISVPFQGKPFNIIGTQVYILTT